jgi:hypothetical protein
MMDNVFMPFEGDLRDFIDTLETTESYLVYSIERIRNKLYTEETIDDIFKRIHRQITTLTFILVSMLKKAALYRPNNITLQDFLNHLGSYLSYMTIASIKASRSYKKNPIYGIRIVNKNLGDIIDYIRTIKDELNNAIERGLFL